MPRQTPVLVVVPGEASEGLPKGLVRGEPAAAGVSVEWAIRVHSD